MRNWKFDIKKANRQGHEHTNYDIWPDAYFFFKSIKFVKAKEYNQTDKTCKNNTAGDQQVSN